jgi:hypothetical protein
MPKAECGNQTVDRFADCAPSLAKISEISCGCDSQFLAASSEELELAKFAQDALGRVLIFHTLKNFAKNQIRQSKALTTKLTIKVVGLAILQAMQIVDPDRGINDYHRQLLLKPPETRSVQVSVPPDLTPQPANRRLRASLDE